MADIPYLSNQSIFSIFRRAFQPLNNALVCTGPYGRDQNMAKGQNMYIFCKGTRHASVNVKMLSSWSYTQYRHQLIFYESLSGEACTAGLWNNGDFEDFNSPVIQVLAAFNFLLHNRKAYGPWTRFFFLLNHFPPFILFSFGCGLPTSPPHHASATFEFFFLSRRGELAPRPL